MKILLAAGTLLILAPCERPPVEFQGPSAPATVFFAAPEVVDTTCRGRARIDGEPRILACTLPRRGMILLPDPCLYRDRYAQLVCHERAHLDRADGSPGWRH